MHTMPPHSTSQENLPLEFDPDFYRARNSELRNLDDSALRAHYRNVGRVEGLQASAAALRSGFLPLCAGVDSILEIGPFNSPAMRGRNVKYFDVVDTENLKKKAVHHGLDPATCPNIDYVSEHGDLGIVDANFSAVFSSHAIEHQPDLVRHLHEVTRLLRPGGRYFVIAPDKRFCFDHFKPASSLGKILGAHMAGITNHSYESVIDYFSLMTHNEASRHWRGDHGAPACEHSLTEIRHALALCATSGDGYLDSHAWQFTPESFKRTLDALYELDLIALKPLRVYDTVRDQLEFCAVLEKTEKSAVPIRKRLPPDFDEAAYLLANPDVAAAGADASQHYLIFGQAEGRRLR